jgi:prepilin-type N-terminal cleavage/methylation domain-containing protein
MLKKIREAKENESGFTLIELLIVIVILGVLAGIVVFSVSGVNNQSKTAACKADVKTVEVAGEAYIAQTGGPAASMDVLKPSFLHSVPTDVTYTVTGGTFTAVGIPATC